MNQSNATVLLRPNRLNLPLPTLYARQLHSFVIDFGNIPDDNTSIVCRIFKTDLQAHFDIPVSRFPTDGIGRCYAIGTCFPDVGAAFYEVHAYDANGNMTALGRGEVSIDAFTGTGAPIPPGQSVPVMQITDRDGALHTIRAVPDGYGNYTTILDDTNEG